MEMECVAPKTAFFTVLVGDFSEKLKMPNDFVDNYAGIALCKLEGPTGESWNVKLEKENDVIFFRKGWKKFVMENFLNEGHFLVFNYDGDSCFKVTIYDESFCEMDMETANIKRGGKVQTWDHVVPGESRIFEFRSVNFCFKRSLKKLIRYHVNIPVTVVRGLGLQMRDQNLKLVDPRNRSWNVKVKPMLDGRLLINSGWHACCTANQIEEGHTIVFEFMKEHIKLHIFRAKVCDVTIVGPNVVA